MSDDAIPVALPPSEWREVVAMLDDHARLLPPDRYPDSVRAVQLCDRINAQLHGPRLVLAPVLGGDVVRMFPDEVPAGDAS